MFMQELLTVAGQPGLRVLAPSHVVERVYKLIPEHVINQHLRMEANPAMGQSKEPYRASPAHVSHGNYKCTHFINI